MTAEHMVLVTHGPTTSRWWCLSCPAKDAEYTVPAHAEADADRHRAETKRGVA